LIVYCDRINALLHPPAAAVSSRVVGTSGADGFDWDSSFPKDNVPILPMKGIGAHGTELSSYWRSSSATNSEYLNQQNVSPISKVRPSNWDNKDTKDNTKANISEPLSFTATNLDIIVNDDERYVDDGFLDNEVMRAGALTVPVGGNGMFAQGAAFRAARTAALK
jgi:hypothetical protein